MPLGEHVKVCLESELLAAQALWQTLEDYKGHVFDINFDVFRNRIMESVFGGAVCRALREERKDNERRD